MASRWSLACAGMYRLHVLLASKVKFYFGLQNQISVKEGSSSRLWTGRQSPRGVARVRPAAASRPISRVEVKSKLIALMQSLFSLFGPSHVARTTALLTRVQFQELRLRS